MGLRSVRASALAASLLVLAGCASIGPQRMGIDRADYANHLRETNKEQLLLNIVALRYGDAPLFLEVSSVISQYTREGTVRAQLDIDPPPDAVDGNVSGQVLLRETPTITYAPLSGDRFARSLLSPILPASLLGMIESGWSPELLFRIAARSINGVGGGSRNTLFARPANEEFEPMLAALARLQRSRGMIVHVERGEGSRFTARASLAPGLGAADRADLDYVARVLNLPGRGGELPIVFAEAQTAPDQLAIGTRSMFEIFSEMAQGVDVPAGEQEQAIPAVADAGYGRTLIRVRSGLRRPADVHVAIRYRGHWFWIDGSDVDSKRMFLIAQILLSLNDTSSSGTAPLVTIPAG